MICICVFCIIIVHENENYGKLTFFLFKLFCSMIILWCFTIVLAVFVFCQKTLVQEMFFISTANDNKGHDKMKENTISTCNTNDDINTIL